MATEARPWGTADEQERRAMQAAQLEASVRRMTRLLDHCKDGAYHNFLIDCLGDARLKLGRLTLGRAA